MVRGSGEFRRSFEIVTKLVSTKTANLLMQIGTPRVQTPDREAKGNKAFFQSPLVETELLYPRAVLGFLVAPSPVWMNVGPDLIATAPSDYFHCPESPTE